MEIPRGGARELSAAGCRQTRSEPASTALAFRNDRYEGQLRVSTDMVRPKRAGVGRGPRSLLGQNSRSPEKSPTRCRPREAEPTGTCNYLAACGMPGVAPNRYMLALEATVGERTVTACGKMLTKR
jgi:hypothetical protein